MAPVRVVFRCGFEDRRDRHGLCRQVVAEVIDTRMGVLWLAYIFRPDPVAVTTVLKGIHGKKIPGELHGIPVILDRDDLSVEVKCEKGGHPPVSIRAGEVLRLVESVRQARKTKPITRLLPDPR
jgi:hypothetical protein